MCAVLCLFGTRVVGMRFFRQGYCNTGFVNAGDIEMLGWSSSDALMSMASGQLEDLMASLDAENETAAPLDVPDGTLSCTAPMQNSAAPDCALCAGGDTCAAHAAPLPAPHAGASPFSAGAVCAAAPEPACAGGGGPGGGPGDSPGGSPGGGPRGGCAGNGGLSTSGGGGRPGSGPGGNPQGGPGGGPGGEPPPPPRGAPVPVPADAMETPAKKKEAHRQAQARYRARQKQARQDAQAASGAPAVAPIVQEPRGKRHRGVLAADRAEQAVADTRRAAVSDCEDDCSPERGRHKFVQGPRKALVDLAASQHTAAPPASPLGGGGCIDMMDSQNPHELPTAPWLAAGSFSL